MPKSGVKTTGWRRHWGTIALAVPAILLVAFLVTYEECDASCGDWDYVDDLLLEDGQVIRWAYGPSLATSNGNSEEIDMLIDAVDELNKLLLNTDFALQFTREGSADIEVTFGSQDELNKLNPDYQIDSKIRGYAKWDWQQGALDAASIFVVRNLQQGEKWGTVLHELGHAMGIVGHTDRYYSSLFHAELGYGSLSDGFSSDDRKLLSFLYQHLKPGAKEPEVRAAFDKHWVPRAN